MNRRFLIQPEAKVDILEAARSLENMHSGAGCRFLALIQRYVDLIETNPLLFGLLFEDVRAVTIRKYRYVIIYRVLDDLTEILAVVHGSRDRSSWESRLS